jgi:hypothetical protein
MGFSIVPKSTRLRHEKYAAQCSQNALLSRSKQHNCSTVALIRATGQIAHGNTANAAGIALQFYKASGHSVDSVTVSVYTSAIARGSSHACFPLRQLSLCIARCRGEPAAASVSALSCWTAIVAAGRGITRGPRVRRWCRGRRCSHRLGVAQAPHYHRRRRGCGWGR